MSPDNFPDSAAFVQSSPFSIFHELLNEKLKEVEDVGLLLEIQVEQPIQKLVDFQLAEDVHIFESVNIELGVEGGVIAPFCRAVFLGRQGVKGLRRFFGVDHALELSESLHGIFGLEAIWLDRSIATHRCSAVATCQCTQVLQSLGNSRGESTFTTHIFAHQKFELWCTTLVAAVGSPHLLHRLISTPGQLNSEVHSTPLVLDTSV
mmetsp:Transcript_35239/g.51724  ORF Transcript_35239/g.51724 Transcript_35239/m.51724 type:complete len:206 (-) Transcript_35239:821-1438(-)